MERLQKLLSAAGICSRRDAEELIRSGRVAVNGVTAVLGQKADPLNDLVTLDGRRVNPGGRLEYLVLNKPAGVVTTLSDEGQKMCEGSCADQKPRFSRRQARYVFRRPSDPHK